MWVIYHLRTASSGEIMKVPSGKSGYIHSHDLWIGPAWRQLKIWGDCVWKKIVITAYTVAGPGATPGIAVVTIQ
jgi:hypothetical protein